jgi:hypothetical protein
MKAVRFVIFLLTAWIGGTVPVRAELPGEEPITPDQRDHWAFKPLVRPKLPTVRPDAAINGPIDAFIVARLHEKGLNPAPGADRVALARRVTFDLTGLPPRPDDADAFAADPAADAYERLVDRLLASPAHGDHAAQPWLDLARFAETDGFEHDLVRPEAWRYRDWVIDAVNRDLPYDRFVSLQIAADEIEPDNPAAAIATGFCLAGPDMPDINSQDERRHNLLNDIAATVGSVYLGLQVGCAQCHDHKYDPISQGDFYRLRAFFAPTLRVQKNKSMSVMTTKGSKSEGSYVMVRGDYRRPGERVEPEFPRIANSSSERPSASKPRAALARWLTRPDQPLATRVIANRLWQQHFGEGLCRTPSDFGAMGDEPQHLELLDYLATELPRREWSQKQLRRVIVTSASYRQASKTSPAWDAATRHHVATVWAKAKQADPQNRLWWRYPLRRVPAESLRDAMLACCDSLSSRRGGRGVMAPLPAEMTAMLLKNQWQVAADEDDRHRRSIYLFARRNLRFPILDVFDRTDGQASCPVRNRSTTAPQSLLLLNSEFSLTVARRLAGAVVRQAGPQSRPQIVEAYRRAFARLPDAAELQSGEEFLDRQRKLLAREVPPASRRATPIPVTDSTPPAAGAALVDLCLALINANEFLYLD